MKNKKIKKASKSLLTPKLTSMMKRGIDPRHYTKWSSK